MVLGITWVVLGRKTESDVTTDKWASVATYLSISNAAPRLLMMPESRTAQ
jgi:hypothetical protein